MSVTLKDIAKRANVSISTVSRIINNDQTKPASKETSDKVWRIVREMGYVPNLNARSLIKGEQESEGSAKTKAIGCIFTSTKDTYSDPFYSQIAKGVQIEAATRGYLMGYSFSSCDMTDSALYNNITTNRVDGAVILGRFNRDFLMFLKNNIKNLAYGGINYVGGGFDEVICDGFKGAAYAVEHLINLGHTEIGYVGPIPGSNEDDIINEHRFDGFKHAMREHNIKVCDDFISVAEPTIADGYRGMQKLLMSGRLPSAVFCANDRIAVGAMKAIREKGLSVPKDIAMIGLDDLEMSEYVRPALSTIRIPKEELGRFAAKVLIDRIEKGHELPVRVDIPFELVIRESCGGKK